MHPRSRRRLFAVTLLCAACAAVSAAHAQAPLTCRDFVRFDERWQRCVAPDGSVEFHRVGVLFHAGAPAALPAVTQTEAATITITVREKPDSKSLRPHDPDKSGGLSAGDFVDGRIFLLKSGRRVGVVHLRSVIQSLQGSQLTLRDTLTVRLAGGHLYSVWDHTEDHNDVPNVGETDHIPVQRGDGRFAGYTGEVISRVVKVLPTGEPVYVDTITLTKR